jgi:polysaccharide biosynthesis transport protein
MQNEQRVDFLPYQNELGVEASQGLRQRRQWQIFCAVFVVVMLVANVVLWNRAAVYHSQALLQVSYPASSALQGTDLSQQFIAVHQQRLTSNSVLNAVAAAMQRQGILVDAQTLGNMLVAQENTVGRTLLLSANGVDAPILKPIVDTWISYYLSQVQSDARDSNVDELQQTDENLASIQSKIVIQQQTLSDFAQTHNIVSLERDENRNLSKVKGLTASLDAAEAQKVEALADLEALNAALAEGQAIVHPKDKAAIDATSNKIAELNSLFDALLEKYTETYINRDPELVAKMKIKTKLEEQLKQQISDSKIAYLQEAQRTLAVAVAKVTNLKEELDEQFKLAQQFSQELEQYKRLDAELKALQNQEQMLKNQLVSLDMAHPVEAKIVVLEEANVAEYPIGPNYWFDSLLAFIAALLLALLAMTLYSFVINPRAKNKDTPNIMVFSPYTPTAQSGLGAPNMNPGLSPPIANQHSPMQLTHATDDSNTRGQSISVAQCQQLFKVANKQAKVVMGLILSGVAPQELASLCHTDFTEDYGVLNIQGNFARQIVMTKVIADLLRASKSESASIWHQISSEEDFSQLITNAAFDAKISHVEQMNLQVLRNTYLNFLAEQGIRLNDLEQIAGYIAPSELAKYRQQQQTSPLNVADADTIYPFTNMM